MDNATWVEWVWTVTSAIGLLMVLVLQVEAIKDRAAARKEARRIRRIARGNLIDEGVKVYLMAAFTLVGIIAMFTPSLPGQASDEVSLLGAVLGLSLTIGDVLMVVSSIIGVYARKTDRDDREAQWALDHASGPEEVV